MSNLNSNSQLDDEQLYNKVIKSVVSIKAGDRIMGSGFIDKNLNVITAYHVVAGENNLQASVMNITVPLNINMYNPYTDIAILDIDPAYKFLIYHRGITGLETAYSDSIHITQKVMVIGSPQGLEHTVTTGIISSINGEQPEINDQAQISGYTFDLIQHSAGTYYGNSGGPVFDTQGRVIGISDNGVPGSAILNFAVSSDEIYNLYHNYLYKGNHDYNVGSYDLMHSFSDNIPSVPYVGLSGEDYYSVLNEVFGIKTDGGCIVTSIMHNTPAELANLQKGTLNNRLYSEGNDTGVSSDADVITNFGGQPVTSCKDLFNFIAHYGFVSSSAEEKPKGYTGPVFQIDGKGGYDDIIVKGKDYPMGKSVKIIMGHSQLTSVLNNQNNKVLAQQNNNNNANTQLFDCMNERIQAQQNPSYLEDRLCTLLLKKHFNLNPIHNN